METMRLDHADLIADTVGGLCDDVAAPGWTPADIVADERPGVVSVPKAFFTKEREQIYSDWKIAFWRELVQNAVDAGATRIDITIGTARRRGSFGRAADDGEVPTIVFTDNGCGMSRETLDEVYFSIGRSTKSQGASIGGFGRARLLTCFAQARYSVHTRDRVVEGDGGEYRNMALAEAIVAVRRWLAGAEAAAAKATTEAELARHRGNA